MEVMGMRLRLAFEDARILSKSQKRDGLKRCWVLLKPHLNTINDVVSYLIESFNLYGTCPNGITLSMDGFVLPPFESISILKDKDIIRVKRKGTKLGNVKAIERGKTLIEEEVIEKQPLPSGIKLLTNEEFDKEAGGYQSETDEDEDKAEENLLLVENVRSRDVASKKRKASTKIDGSKKRQRQMTPERAQKKHAHQREHTKTPRKKRKHDSGSKQDASSNPEANEKSIKNLEPTSDSEKHEEPEESRERVASESGTPNGVQKVCRSTRRKKLQRRWRKEQRAKDKMEKCEQQPLVNNLNADSGYTKDMNTDIREHEQADEASDSEGDLVPVVIRPGLIRYTTSKKAEELQQIQQSNGWDSPSNKSAVCEDHSAKHNAWGAQKSQVAKESFQWNGTTNKRKHQDWSKDNQTTTSWKDSNNHQQWNKEKQTTSSWKDSNNRIVSTNHSQQDNTLSHRGRLQETCQWNGITNKRKGQKWGQEKHQSGSWKESREYDAHSSGTWASRRHRQSAVDFEKLVPLTDSPKSGDVIAYRLLELSSSWCPELSSFRVGKISAFEPESNRIMLVPVPEHPLDLGKEMNYDDNDEDASGQPPASSVYDEDGCLEIDFPSLVDVRILKRGALNQPAGSASPVTNGTPVPSGTSCKVNETHNGTKDVAIPAANDNMHGGSKNVSSDAGNGELQTPAPVNGKKDVWEEISEALSAKKEQLMKEDSWNKKENSAKRTWSQRTLRSSALGPTMARLRAQNGI